MIMDENCENGPDQIIPSTSTFTTQANGAVEIKYNKDAKDSTNIVPMSVPSLVKRTSERFPDHAALMTKTENGTWRKTTYREYYQKIWTCAKAFIKLGLEMHNGVGVLGFNSEEWFVADLAAIFAGGMVAGIYTTNSPESCYHCLSDSKSNIVVVEDTKQLDKILQIRSRLPHLKAIIQYAGTPPTENGMIYSWDKIMKIGEAESDEILQERIKKIGVNYCCTLVYTSGTVGYPKGVMLSHDNIIWNVQMCCKILDLEEGAETLVSYLPLSHIAAQIIDLYIPILVGGVVYFADKNALKGSLVNTLQEAQPTQFLGVPRVWEKIYEKMQQLSSQSNFIAKTISSWAKNVGLHHNLNKMKGGHSTSWSYSLAKSIVFNKVRHHLGLSRAKNLLTGAAPLAEDIQRYFMSLDLVLLELFGMSETAGAHTANTHEDYFLGSVGKTLHGASTKIHEPDFNQQGEICIYGRHVFMGYLNEVEKTKEVIDSDGWLHTGDIGKEDENGFLFVTGRIKELLITAGGENIPPVHIEQLVQHELPQVSHAVLIGDRKKYLSLLLTFKTEIDINTGAALDTLTEPVKKWLKSMDCEDKTITDLCNNKHSKVMAEIQDAINKVNAKAISNAQRIQKFAILPADFSVATGELGPTLKLRRKIITEKYSDIIDMLYQ